MPESFAKVSEQITIAYERLGDPAAPPVLMIMGLGAQLITWPDGLCAALAGRGLHLVRFDNRDAGLSTHLASAPMPDYVAALAGNYASVTYTLSDMATDTVGLLDALGLDRVHVVGASLGGFVAQTLAIEHPHRVRSLTSIMSTTGARDVGQPHPEVSRALVAGGFATTRAQVVQRAIDLFALTGSPGFPTEPAVVAERTGRAFDRAFDPVGFVRQAVATLASGDRTPRLRELRVPALVIHGSADALVDVSGGRATAAAIPGAELVIIDGMGHDLPPAIWPRLVEPIAALAARS
jgi:pimeloyl-ACP methyl ester carboxylesterase|nr:alpha/beta hydrolase [Kofleriaceae bacterium]